MFSNNKMWLVVIIGLNLILTTHIAAQKNTEPINSIDEYRQLRMQKLNQPRNVIHNNDGNDVIYYPINDKYSVKNLMDMRSSGLIGTDVSTISYTTIASGFGNFTHNTQVGEILTESGFEFGIQNESRNITAEMLAHGTDPIQENAKFAHENGLEFFWSNRVNDTHDAAHRKDKPYFLWTDFKENHPQYLFGSIGESLPNGRWSSLDFDNKEVRDRCVQFYKEVCENYNVDGIELDFFRHFELFRSVGHGGVANKEQLDKLTDMVKQIREVTEKAGMKRGNPILVLTRLPTSPEYAKKAGVDIRSWIDEELVDIVVGSGYFRLDYWKNFAKLGEGKKVKMYAGLSESRVREEHPLLVRQQNSVYRARAAAAWEAGLDGNYSFNEYNTRVRYLSEIGSPGKLRNTNNLYFVTYRDYPADRYLVDGNKYFKTPRLSPTPGNHHSLASGPTSFNIELGDESSPAHVYLPIWVENIQQRDLKVKLNDSATSFHAVSNDGLLIFKIDPSIVKRSINELSIVYSGKNMNGEPTLKDASIFFLRNENDIEMRELIELCISNK